MKSTLKNFVIGEAQKAVAEQIKIRSLPGEFSLFVRCFWYDAEENKVLILDPFSNAEHALIPWAPNNIGGLGYDDPMQALDDFNMLGVRDMQGMSPEEVHVAISEREKFGLMTKFEARLARLIVDQRKYIDGSGSGPSDNEYYVPQIVLEVIFTPDKWPYTARAIRVVELDPKVDVWHTSASVPLAAGHRARYNELDNTDVTENGKADLKKDPQISRYKKSMDGRSVAPFHIGVGNGETECS